MAKYVISTEGAVKVWRNDNGSFPNYSVSFSKKNDEGNYVNCYQSIRFKRGVELENGEEIEIKNAFPSFDIGKDGKKYSYWMVTDFTKAGADDSCMSAEGDAEVVDW